MDTNRMTSRRHAWLVSVGCAIAVALGLPGSAQESATQPMDPEFARLVQEWTTGPEFLSPLVDHLPVSDRVPSPNEVLGHHVGAPGELTYYADALRYYRALAAATPRVAVVPIGTTDEGRELAVVVIGSEESVANLDTYRGYLAQLADPRGLSDADARGIIARAKPIYHLVTGLHSGETGPSEMVLELAYRLAVEDSPLIEAIREQVIVTITPAADPDGRDRYVDWYYRHLIDIDDDRDRITGPPYWGRYVFHDNNRDINYSQRSMRALLDWYLDYHPPIMHDLHESVPFLYTFSGQSPQNPRLDPILYGELPWFANFEMAQLTKYGMPGVWTHAYVDMWSPGYLGFMSSNHNGMLRMYETFGNGGATTMRRRIAPENPFGGQSEGQTSREWYRPSPPYEEVLWSMRNNTNYMQTAVLSALQLTSSFPEIVLENFYRKSLNSIERGTTTPPHGYVIPAGQPDMTRVALLVNLLRRQGIEVGRATADATVGGSTFPAGSYIVKLDQPYGRLAATLLSTQEYPDTSLRTYDDSAWTLGLALDADVRAIDDPAILRASTELVDEAALEGTVDGGRASAAYVVANHGSNHLVTLRYRLKGDRVLAASDRFSAGGRQFPAGSLIVPVARDDVHDRMAGAVAGLGLTAIALAESPAVASHELDLPRLAIFSTWGNTQEVGWVRHAFDRFEIPFDLVYKERVRAGDLRNDYDVILIPNQGRSARGLVFDIDPVGKPLAYTRTERFTFLGEYGESEDITGGMGLDGAAEIQRFVEAGGLLITLGGASAFPPEFGITRGISTANRSSQFYAPGPIVEAEILQPDHPIFYGYADTKVPVRWANGPQLDTDARHREQQTLMRFTGGSAGVLSGLMRNPNEIRMRPAIMDVPTGNGRVLLFATNPCYRWLNHGEFGMLFNAVLHYNDLDAARARHDPPDPRRFTPSAAPPPDRSGSPVSPGPRRRPARRPGAPAAS